MKITYTELSEIGAVRTVNQDRIFSAVDGYYGIFSVADGMGGHFRGEIASTRFIEAVKSWWQSFIAEKYSFEECYEGLKNILFRINQEIYTDFTSAGLICGAAIAILFIYSDRYIVINSGDARIYKKRGIMAVQESKDHNFKSEAIISGRYSKAEINNFSGKNKLTAAVGGNEVPIFFATTSPLVSKCFFICSDGVYKACSKFQLTLAMKKKSVCKFIKDIVESKGAADNYSFILIKIYRS